MSELSSLITPERFDAVLFDLDGVLTATASIHAACWKEMFDEYLQRRSRARGEAFQPFDLDSDYKPYVDGKPRYEGVRSFLQSRDIELPEGDAADPPGQETVCGLGNRKNELVQKAIAAGKVEVYPSSIELVRRLRSQGIKIAVVSSSANCTEVLGAAGITELFQAQVDGLVADELGMPGKPAPDTFLKAAELLGAAPARTVVVEDAIAGVQAGRAGGFGLVIGVNRGGSAESLRDHGTDVVVADLAELLP
jgi:alpha,alpha-trehalase